MNFMNDYLTPSSNCIAIVKNFESLQLKAFKCPAGVWTIGWGHTRGVSEGDTCTEEQAEAWLKEDLEWASADVKKYVKVLLKQNQFDALVSFVYNIGGPNFSTSQLLKLVNRHQTTGAADQFAKWKYANGKVLNGLVKRRRAEADLFLSTKGYSLDNYANTP